jgi:hypothetical protein
MSIRTSIDFHRRILRGDFPTVYILIESSMGWRAFAAKGLTNIFSETGSSIADGTHLADGTIIAGSSTYGTLSIGERLISPGSFERTMRPANISNLQSYGARQLQSINIDLDNSEDYCSKIIAKESFLGKELRRYKGFEDHTHAQHLRDFSGIITKIALTSNGNIMSITADEQ